MGGLFGGGGSSSSATTKTTNVTTTTTSKVGDVGLTGQNAVDAIKSLVSGVVAGAQVNASSLQQINQESGKNYQQLIGGANNLVATAPLIAAGAAAKPEPTDFSKMLIPALLLFGGVMISKQF